MNTLYILTAAGFILLTAVFLFLITRLINAGIRATDWTDEKKRRIQLRMIVALAVWFLFLAIASLSGFSSNFSLFPVNIGPFLLLPLVTIILVVLSKNTRDILAKISVKDIIRLQVFRVFVEILLWMLFIQQALPVQMTFEGRNWDILSGISALVISRFAVGNRKLLIAWNLICLGLLINIVTIAILSMPTPLRLFPNEPANTIVTHFPFILLPGFLVPLAYTLHFLSLRQLLQERERQNI